MCGSFALLRMEEAQPLTAVIAQSGRYYVKCFIPQFLLGLFISLLF
jgi:hypothetical protein